MYGALDCEAVAEMIDRRRSLLADLTPTSDPGRILCVIGDLDTAMGEGTVESNGIIDDVSRVGGTDRLEVGRTDRPRGPGLALVIEADERSARGRQN